MASTTRRKQVVVEKEEIKEEKAPAFPSSLHHEHLRQLEVMARDVENVKQTSQSRDWPKLKSNCRSEMTLLNENNFEAIKKTSDCSIDSIVTDPPYGLRFMNKHWDYDVPNIEIWKECLRVLKPGGHLLAFGGTRTYHRMVVKIEDAGFEIRDQIQWIYGSGFPKSHNLKEGHSGLGTALKPANEPIVVARKPLEKGLTVAENVVKWGTGAINIEGSRISVSDDDPNHRRNGSVNLDNGGKSSVFQMCGRNPKYNGNTLASNGRWPANVILDETAADMLDAQSGILKSGELLGYKSKASRFFYIAKASKSERNAGLEGMPLVKSGVIGTGDGGGPMLTGSGNERTNLNQNFHPTVKPIKLMEYLIRLVTPLNGTVMDLFMGSGSTGVAAKNLNFKFIGIEIDVQYFEIAKRRISAALASEKDK